MGMGGSPDPPEDIHKQLTPPVCSNYINVGPDQDEGDDSDADANEYEGYELLPVAPGVEDQYIMNYGNNIYSDDEAENSDENDEENNMENGIDINDEQMNVDDPNVINGFDNSPPGENSMPSVANVPPIEPIGRSITRRVWSTPRQTQNISMDSGQAQQVMSAMANFTLPPSSYPEWAHSISEDEWKEQLATRINRSQENR